MRFSQAITFLLIYLSFIFSMSFLMKDSDCEQPRIALAQPNAGYDLNSGETFKVNVTAQVVDLLIIEDEDTYCLAEPTPEECVEVYQCTYYDGENFTDEPCPEEENDYYYPPSD